MSAYVCHPSMFALLAIAAVRYEAVPRELECGTQEETAELVASVLAMENVRSVRTRYPGEEDGKFPGPGLLAAQVEEAASVYAQRLYRKATIEAVQVLKACDCYEYQSCETEDWKTTQAHEVIEQLRSESIRKLPGYDEMRWEWKMELTEVEAMFYGQ